MKKLTAIIISLILVFSCIIPTALVASAASTPLTELYKESNYKFHGSGSYSVEVNADEEYIKSSNNQTKSMLDYSHDMTTFNSSVTIQGSSTGTFYGGVAFHVQADDFKTGTFNTAGYSVILNRNKNTKDKVKLMVRYCTAGAYKKELSYEITNIPESTTLKLRLDIEVDTTNFKVKVLSEDGATQYGETKTYKLDATADYSATAYYESGAFALITNGVHTFTKLSINATAPMANIPVVKPANPLSDKYTVYGITTTENGFTSVDSGIARGILKNTEDITDFSAELVLKTDSNAGLKSGIIFRVKSAGVATDDMEGYSLIAQKITSGADAGKIRIYLYKYGKYNGANAYLGRIAYVAHDFGTVAAGQEFTLHINVVGDKLEAYCYETDNKNNKSEVLKASLKSDTDSAKNDTDIYYDKGSVGFYATNGSVKALDFTVNKAEEITPEKPLGTPAEENYIGTATKGDSDRVADVSDSNISAPSVDNLDEYTDDFYNYTYYSSSTANKFLIKDNSIISTTTGTKRAILDGVTVKGFHATATMKISSEGTLRSGIVFRLNNVEKGLSDDGALGSNSIEGYAAVLYKTPSTSGSHARVVLLIYKYGIKNGEYKYLGTVASKSSEVPLGGCENKVTDAAGKQLTMDVNLVEDKVTAYFYNADNPSLKSEALVASLNDETDVEGSTPSLKGVYYDSGAIGLTAIDYVTFTKFTLEEPIYPANKVGDLSQLDSFIIYGSGVEKDGEYFTSNSSGTKKMIVNNLTVKDFTASVDMTIDKNGNLKSGFFFRVNEVGNSGDAQTGYAIIVSRNYNTNGDTNPNRIDIVVFKWGYVNGKLTYLGELAREAYKSGKTFMDGKMAGEELTFVIRVKGAALDATLYQKKDLKNKPATFSTNLKFAASKEKDSTAYFDSGSIGLYLGNSSSDPYNINQLRNFHINDGSGVKVKTTFKSVVNAVFNGIPATGEGIFMTVVAGIFVISLGALTGLLIYGKRGKKETGVNTL